MPPAIPPFCALVNLALGTPRTVGIAFSVLLDNEDEDDKVFEMEDIGTDIGMVVDAGIGSGVTGSTAAWADVYLAGPQFREHNHNIATMEKGSHKSVNDSPCPNLARRRSTRENG